MMTHYDVVKNQVFKEYNGGEKKPLDITNEKIKYKITYTQPQ